eukprot:scaffold63919_cov55-Phaeocystis_antarctica.AAC.3
MDSWISRATRLARYTLRELDPSSIYISIYPTIYLTSDAPPASAASVSCPPCSVRPLSVAARVASALASRGESSTAPTRLSTSDAAPPLAAVPPLASCSVVQRLPGFKPCVAYEAPLMSAWYVACASNVA